MRNETRLQYNQLLRRIAELNGVEDASKSFSVDPSITQKLVERLGQSSDFMSRINVIPVKEQEGEKLGIGATRPIASRTDTSKAGSTGRTPIDPTDNASLNRYRCEKTNSDTAIKYVRLDAWAHRPEFQTLVRDAILAQKARDAIMIGFNGVKVAAETSLTNYPLLQDVNIGWLEQIRKSAPDRVLSEGEKEEGKILIRAAGGGDYVNLDALVYDGIELLDEWHRDATDLVAVVGRDLVHDKYFRIVNASGDDPVKQMARDVILSSKQIGGLPAVRVPFFLPKSLMITSLSNLSLYVQEGSQRRFLQEEPKFDQVANYESENDAFVVEDFGKAALFENIDTERA
jgi:P2 family phage major capsid protein